MTMTNEITGTGRNGARLTVRVGDRVRFDTNSNLGVREDIVRACFVQTDSLGNSFPAVVLMEHSWTALTSIVARTPRLVGNVTSFDGRYFVVDCPDAPASLRTMHLIRGQMFGAKVGDRVRLEYHSTPSRGLWHVVDVLGNN